MLSPQLALMAVGLMTLACAPTQAHRELFTHDCQGQLHMMSDTPFTFSFGARDFDKMWSHIVRTLKTRLKCKCGQDMDPDEFLRKFHPLPAVLNLLSLQPVTNAACNTTFSALDPAVQMFFRDYVRKYGKGPTQNGPVIPCSYTDLASPGGCKFELKPKSATLDLGLGVAMKTCPSNSDLTFVSVVVKGALVDNLAKPCDATNACGAGLVCKDASTLYDLFPGRRRLWSLFEPFDKLFSAITESKLVRVIKEKLAKLPWLDAVSVDAVASALRSLAQTLKEGFDKVQAAESRRRGRRILLTPSDNDVWSVLKETGLYDDGDGTPGCLTFSQLVANARGFAQVFFPDAAVAQDATYNVCVPQFSTTNFDVSNFFSDNWGLTWIQETAPPTPTPPPSPPPVLNAACDESKCRSPGILNPLTGIYNYNYWDYYYYYDSKLKDYDGFYGYDCWAKPNEAYACADGYTGWFVRNGTGSKTVLGSERDSKLADGSLSWESIPGERYGGSWVGFFAGAKNQERRKDTQDLSQKLSNPFYRNRLSEVAAKTLDNTAVDLWERFHQNIRSEDERMRNVLQNFSQTPMSRRQTSGSSSALTTCEGAVNKYKSIESACPQAFLGKENHSYYDTSQNKTIEYEYDRWERNPASCGKATECPAAISSINDTVFSAMKTGFAACAGISGFSEYSASYFINYGFLRDYLRPCGLPASTAKLTLNITTCWGAVTKASLLESACPQGYVGKGSYYSTSQKKTIEYDRWERNPASCGKATECPAAISSINDMVFSAMKTGFAACAGISGFSEYSASYFINYGFLRDYLRPCGLPASTAKLTLNITTCWGAVTKASLLESACPQAFLGKENHSYYDTEQKKTIEYEYDRWERTPASCGKDTECPSAINSITNTVFSAMKTGFAACAGMPGYSGSYNAYVASYFINYDLLRDVIRSCGLPLMKYSNLTYYTCCRTGVTPTAADLVQDCDGSTNGGGLQGWRRSFDGYAGSCSSTISHQQDDCITCDEEQKYCKAGYPNPRVVQNFSVPVTTTPKPLLSGDGPTRSWCNVDTKVVSYYTCCKTRLPGDLPQGDRYDPPELGYFVTIPFTSWSGDLSRGRNVLDATRLDGSYFVGSATALRPPVANKEQKILPFFGSSCSGTAFLQVGDKLGVGMSFKGLSSMFSFVMEQAVKMQQCRANQRSPDFVFARPDFMKHFALYTPVAWLSLMMKPPAGKEFDIMAEKLVNDWNTLEIKMSTVVKKMFTEVLKMQDFPYRFDMSSVSTCNAKDYSTRGCAMSMDISKVGVGGGGTNAVFGMMQCFSASPAVPFPVIGVSLIGGNTALTTWPVKSCSVNTDCPIGLECADGLGLTDALKNLNDPFDLLIYGSSDSSPPSGSCKSTMSTNNKGIAKIVEYFTDLPQADDTFAFCLPKFTLPDLEALAEKQPEKYDGKDLYKIKGLNSYAGVLPGLTDQPSLVFFFPPADSESYTWPQKMQRRVEWTSFNFQSGSKITLNLRSAGGVIDTKSLDNDNSEPYTMAADRGPGYWLEICYSTGICWASGQFAVVAEITNRAPPVAGTQSWPNNGQDFTAGSEAYGVFAGAVKTNLAQVLRAASHRIEIEKIASVARRAGSSVTVTYLIHPDDTGKDIRTVGSLLEKAQSPAIKDAVVGNLAVFAASAQTTNPAAQGISQSGVFTDVTAARNVESAIKKSQYPTNQSKGLSKGISIRSNSLFTFFVAFLCSGIVFR